MNDEAFYDQALRRMDRIAVVLAGAAVLYALARQGWPGALGAGAGSLVSFLNVRMWKRVAASLSPSEAPARSSSAALAGLRYLLLGSGIFVIIKYFGVSVLAVFMGLLVGVAAAILEMIYELIFTSHRT